VNFSAWAIRKPVPAVLLFVVLTLAGWMSFRTLSIQNIPDLDLPTVTVTATLPGSTAATMETEVTRKLEDSFATLDRIDHITSTVTEGSSVTTVQFKLEKPTQEAVDDVRDAVSKVRSQLPADVDEPIIQKMTMAGQALLTYAVHSKTKSEGDLSWYIDNDIAKQLLSVDGVSTITRVGGIDRQIRVELDPERMAALNITAAEINAKLRPAIQDAGGGRTDFSGGEQSVRAAGAVTSVEQLRAVPLNLANGQRILLSDIANIVDGAAEQRQTARLDGMPVVAFQVFRTTGTSEVSVAAAVRQHIAALTASNPDVKIVEISNSVSRVKSQYDASMEALYEGALLAVAVVWLFLRDLRATIVSAVALPLSMLPTFFAMKLFGFSLNSITLLALTLVVGILVDDAIVEVENIFRHLGMGKPPLQSAMDAAAEIGLAVIATSMTLVAVFLPVAFMDGIPGKFFKQFGWTSAIAVLASLLVARLLTPMMAAYMLKPVHHAEEEGRLTRQYRRMLEACMRHPWRTVAGAIAFFVASLALMQQLPAGFVPKGMNGKLAVAVELAPGARLSDTEHVVEEVRQAAKNVPEVLNFFASIGGSDVRKASLTLNLMEGRKEDAVEADLRARVANIPGARFSFGVGGSGEKLTLVLSGDNNDALQAAANAVERDLRTLHNVGNVTSSASLLMPELTIEPDLQRAADLGVTATSIGEALRVATTGDFDTNLPKLNLDERQLDVLVSLPESVRSDPNVIGQLRVAGNQGPVPLANFSTLSVKSGPAEIDRYDRSRNVTLSVELAGRPIGEVLKEVNALPSLKALPAGVKRQASGDLERMQELFSSFGLAMAFGVLAVYFVLVLLFHDFVQPATILVALPLSVGGAVIALMLGNYSLSMPALIGLLMLMGIATKNSILLVEYAARMQREESLLAMEAMREAASKRVRPILMTTVAMGAGMLPIALSTSGDNSFRAPMATAVIGGLLTSTILSLFVVPAVYLLVDRLKSRARIWRKNVVR
jgi:multidrug efflux pump subunit AcrB